MYLKENRLYTDQNGRKVLELGVLPQKHCTFHCVYCPLGPGVRTELAHFGPEEEILSELDAILANTEAETVFLRGNGEPLVHDGLKAILQRIKKKGFRLGMYSNGYLLGKPGYMELADLCDEILGNLTVASTEGMHKVHRPVEGYSFEGWVEGMAAFKAQYKGEFTLKVTIFRNYSDSEAQVETLKAAVKKIRPDVLVVDTMRHGNAVKGFAISEERLSEIRKELEAAL